MDEADGVVGEIGAELGDDRGGGIVEARDSEENLVFSGIILAAVAGESFEHPGIEAVERLQDANGRRESGREARTAEKGARAPDGDEIVAKPGDGEERGEACDDGGEHSVVTHPDHAS
jgi:hypothetical protein